MSMTISVGDDRDDDATEDGRDLRDGRRDADDHDDRPGDDEKRRPSKGSDQDSDDTDDDDSDRTPEELLAEVKRLRSALAKSNSTGLRRRNQLKELRAATAAATDADVDLDDDDSEDGSRPEQRVQPSDLRSTQRAVDKAVKRRERELEDAHRRDLIDTRAETALTRAGVSDKNIRLLKRELDYDELDLLKDRTVDGLEEEIDRLRGEFPDLFRGGKGGRRRINGGDDRDAGGKRVVRSASAQQAAALRGRG